MNWAADFYHKQNLWSGVYTRPVEEWHRAKAGLVAETAGPGPWRVLELGAGGGQNAAALADAGHTAAMIELLPELAAHARKLASERDGRLTVLEGDFYEVNPGGPFDLVCYWDGFGLGSDDDQRRLLQRVAGWLAPGGCALIEIYTPWYWSRAAGRSWQVGRATRRYDFDAAGCRALDTWWPDDDQSQAVLQSLRCYTPVDLRLLLEGTGLQLTAVEPGGGMDFESGEYKEKVELEKAMQYVAKLEGVY